MDKEYIAGNIKDLRPSEQVLAYLHQNNIPLTVDALNTHAEQIKADLNLSCLPHDLFKYLSNGVWEYRESDVAENILTYKRVDLFLHPRFAPISVHSHSYFEIKYLLSGSANILVGGQSILMNPGDLVFIAPKVDHMVSIYDADSLLLNAIITPDAATSAFPRIYFSENTLSRFFSAATQGKNEPSRLICHTGSDETVQRLFLDAYHKCNSAGTIPSYLLCEAFIEHLMLEVLNSHAEDFELNECLSSVPEALFPILGYINDHCASVDLTTLAKVFSYSPAHLSRLIKQNTGNSFSSLLRSARMNQASTFLLQSDLPIQDIMLHTGYTGKAHFYRVFQETFGMTPAQFRKEHAPSKK